MRFTIHHRETLFQGYFRIERLHLSHDRFDGRGQIGPFTREILDRGQAAALLPYDPLTDQVLLIEQFRAGLVAQHAPEPWTLEIVAGIIGGDHTPEAVARRETMEESGCSIDEVVFVAEIYTSPGCVTEKCTIFLGHANLDQAGGVFGLPEEHEDIRVHLLDFSVAMEWLEAGRIRTAPAVVALQWLALHRDQIRKCWLDL
jgi:ADP-ribose pyrophosphatase